MLYYPYMDIPKADIEASRKAALDPRNYLKSLGLPWTRMYGRKGESKADLDRLLTGMQEYAKQKNKPLSEVTMEEYLSNK